MIQSKHSRSEQAVSQRWPCIGHDRNENEKRSGMMSECAEDADDSVVD
jgi:hypothetical protein